MWREGPSIPKSKQNLIKTNWSGRQRGSQSVGLVLGSMPQSRPISLRESTEAKGRIKILIVRY